MAVRLLSNREAELFAVIVSLSEKLDATSNSTEMTRLALAQEAASDLSFRIDEDDVAEAAETISGS